LSSQTPQRLIGIAIVALAALHLGYYFLYSAAPAYSATLRYRNVLGPQSVIVITVDFSDTRGTGSTDFIREMIFVKNNNYFKEASYNQTWIVGDITRQWYQLPGTAASYEWDGQSDPWRYFQTFIANIVKLADDDVDYSKYRFVTIVHSGKWRNAWGFINSHTVVTAEGTFRVNVPIISIHHSESVFAHELAHVFGGLPDMYGKVDSQFLPVFVGPWCLMSQTDRRYVQHFSSWSKIKMGWLSPRAVVTVPWRANTTVTVDPLELPSSGVQAIKMSLWGSDLYYLVEVRQKVGFDKDLPDQGMVIYLVDERKTEWGQSVLVVQDSTPETRTLDDAPFDLRAGKQAAFFDRDNDVSALIVGKSGSSYKLFVGPVKLGELAVRMREKFSRTLEIIEQAKASIQKATTEGRTEGLEKAKSLLANSVAALERGDYDTAIALASQAKEVAETSTYPKSYYEAKDLLSKARSLRTQAQSSVFSATEAQRLMKQALETLDSAEKAFLRTDFATALSQAQDAVDLFTKAFSAEKAFLDEQRKEAERKTMTYVIVGVSTVVMVALAIALLHRKKKIQIVQSEERPF